MQLSNLFPDDLVWRVAFTFGHRDEEGAPVPQEHVAWAERHLKVLLAELCGGGRISTDAGFYLYGSGALADETSTTIWSYGRGPDVPFPRLVQAARDVAHALRQDSVLLVLEQVPAHLEFVSAHGTPVDAAELPLVAVALPTTEAPHALV